MDFKIGQGESENWIERERERERESKKGKIKKIHLSFKIFFELHPFGSHFINRCLLL